MSPQLIKLTYVLVDDGDAMFVRIVEIMWWKKTTTMNSRGLSVVILTNVLLIVKSYTMWAETIGFSKQTVNKNGANVLKIC